MLWHHQPGIVFCDTSSFFWGSSRHQMMLKGPPFEGGPGAKDIALKNAPELILPQSLTYVLLMSTPD